MKTLLSGRGGILGAALATSSAPQRLALAAAGMFFTILLIALGGAAVQSSSAACGPGAGAAPATELTGALKGVPKELIPIYQAASQKYKLGTQGPSILAAINSIETNFGENQGPSSAGAVGWMQFMPATWAQWGVDADHDGKKDPADPDDAIFAAAAYLKASGAPRNWHDAIFAYNHAEWYVDDVLAAAKRFGGATSTQVSAPATAAPTQISSNASVQGIKKSYSDFSVLVASGTGLSLRVVGGWTLAEGGPDDNPLNIGPGKHYGSIEAGAEATIALLKTSAYKGVMASAGKSDDAQMDAIAASPWCPGCAGYRKLLQRTYDSVKANGAPQPAAEEVSCSTPTATGGEQIGELGVGDPDPLHLIRNKGITLDSRAIGDLKANRISPKLVALLSAITQLHKITISVLSTGHAPGTNHEPGRAADIAIVDGEVCNATAHGRAGKCWQLAQELDAIKGKCYDVTELIYYYDPGPSPGSFAKSDHADHVHAGYDGPTGSTLTYAPGTDPCSKQALSGT